MTTFFMFLFAVTLWISTQFTAVQSPTPNAVAPLKLPHHYVVAVIDAGYHGADLNLCSAGHYDFIKNAAIIGDEEDHGTMVGDIIGRRLATIDYCAIIYTIIAKDEHCSADNTAAAINMATAQGVDAINLSISGPGQSELERSAIANAVEHGVAVFIAAGNEGKSLTMNCFAFPACYKIPGIHVVGALDLDGRVADYSNFGEEITEWKYGDVAYGAGLYHGTSFASPRALSDYIMKKARNE